MTRHQALALLLGFHGLAAEIYAFSIPSWVVALVLILFDPDVDR